MNQANTATEVSSSVAESTQTPVAATRQPRKLPFSLSREGKRLRNIVGAAVTDFGMISEGDRIMVCLSGGKDSYTLLDLLLALQVVAPVNFELIAVNLDQKQPDFPEHILPTYLQQLGVNFKIVESDTYSIVTRVLEEGKTMCSLCSRLRRGILYRTAKELGCTKIALGHHREDILETFFLNMFYGGKLKAMPPKLVSDNGEHIVIRPLAYVREKDIVKYAKEREFPIIPCNLCGSQPNLQRAVVGRMIEDWDKKFPGRVETMFRSLQNVVPSHLADSKLFDFQSLSSVRGEPVEPQSLARFDGGDTAFDVDPAIESAMQRDAVQAQTDKPVFAAVSAQ
ncbi:MAG TPA: tRNA 2-thiocytidine(32) synthetase TtcA [Casimicrobium huifangae]|jgi:tRNA 2-thiocytidine biosynthesis protein TtcA|nr:tRNA 2-thiocytidine(32) synthetase TtcA [Casimicrobium huifangae]HQA34044.1 tRNA 2-thiocytidine(32) synthetase TtcA [Casimicrobium huifangae]HQD65401.1 tRNA 2-thiocytidine(32) synthetase TtcA [Casimicrobium huifangae]